MVEVDLEDLYPLSLEREAGGLFTTVGLGTVGRFGLRAILPPSISAPISPQHSPPLLITPTLTSCWAHRLPASPRGRGCRLCTSSPRSAWPLSLMTTRVYGRRSRTCSPRGHRPHLRSPPDTIGRTRRTVRARLIRRLLARGVHGTSPHSCISRYGGTFVLRSSTRLFTLRLKQDRGES